MMFRKTIEGEALNIFCGTSLLINMALRTDKFNLDAPTIEKVGMRTKSLFLATVRTKIIAFNVAKQAKYKTFLIR